MVKYDNLVYMTICEASFKFHKKNNYFNELNSYLGFCSLIKNSFNDNKEGRFNNLFIDIINELDIVFTMDEETTNRYLLNFFLLEKYFIFEEPVRYILHYFTLND